MFGDHPRFEEALFERELGEGRGWTEWKERWRPERALQAGKVTSEREEIMSDILPGSRGT